MECTPGGQRICPRCGYKIEKPETIRCPRCNTILLLKCSECRKCKGSTFYRS